jgi:hypothetical protein
MDAAHRARRPRGGGSRLPNLALVASLFLHPGQVVTPAAASALDVVASHLHLHLAPRTAGEHVILADCLTVKDSVNVPSSMMAYYPADAVGQPQDVSLVKTPDGQSALWANSVTTSRFTVTGVNFTAILGPPVENGQFAGTGYNDYPGNFTCYETYVNNLFTYGASTNCSQVYSCDRSDPRKLPWTGTGEEGTD